MSKEIKVKKEDWFEPEGELVADVWENDKEFIVQAPIAGVKSEDIEVIIEDNILKIKGERKQAEEIKNEAYLLRECYFGSFSKEISLPQAIDKKKIKAEIEQGILTVRLPKKAEGGEKIKIKKK